MEDAVVFVNSASVLCAGTVSLVLLILTASSSKLKEPVFRAFFAMVLLNFLVLACECATYVLEGNPGGSIYAVVRVLDVATYALTPLEALAFVFYLFEFFSLKAPVAKRPFRLVSWVCIACCVLSIVLQAHSVFAYYDAQNNYHPTDAMWMYTAMLMVLVFLTIALVIQHRRLLRLKELLTLLSYFALPLLSYVVSIALPGILISYLASAASVFLIYLNIQMDLRREMLEQEAELVQSRISIMLSQIQPHFLHNALNTIYGLAIQEDADETAAAIADFSDYLQGNLASLSSAIPIPFEEELHHVQSYLSIETRRFENLKVDYDIRETGFMVPSLTLQPLVENAVHHGIGRNGGVGEVVISADCNADGYVVTVRDNGAGFDAAVGDTGADAGRAHGGDGVGRDAGGDGVGRDAAGDGRLHLGIDNVRNRLAMVCNGRLEITSAPGRGTTARIIIPAKEA